MHEYRIAIDEHRLAVEHHITHHVRMSTSGILSKVSLYTTISWSHVPDRAELLLVDEQVQMALEGDGG